MKKIMLGFFLVFVVLCGVTYFVLPESTTKTAKEHTVQQEKQNKVQNYKVDSVTNFSTEYKGYPLSKDGYFGQENENSNTREVIGNFENCKLMFENITAGWLEDNIREHKANVILKDYNGRSVEIPVIIVAKKSKNKDTIILARGEDNNKILEGAIKITLDHSPKIEDTQGNKQQNSKIEPYLYAKDQLIFFYQNDQQKQAFWKTLNH